MKNNSAVIVIPARLNSSRFPKKILEPINGKPLIIHVLERAQKAELCDCYVACCCDEVKNIVNSYGGKAIVTDPSLPSGTDRVFSALSHLEFKPKYVINLQGDNPVFEPSILKDILFVLENNDDADIATPVVLHNNLSDSQNENFHNENTVKVVFENMSQNKPGKAIYFSREAIPNGADKFYSHVGIYAYKYVALEKFVNLPQSWLEKTERLEQLRAIENGLSIWAVPVEKGAISVDVRDDLIAVYNALKL